MIGVVIPACNEEDNIQACLLAVKRAIQQLHVDIEVKVVVVLDSCEDQTLQRVQALQVDYLSCQLRCVGQARDLGVRHLIEQGVTWIACTDADSCVHPDWLMQQLEHQPADLICGVVIIEDWQNLSAHAQELYQAHYQDRMHHRHIHGANLSFSRDAYLQVGGFQGLSCHEDVDLVQRMQSQQRQIVWSNQVRVTTSSRLEGRVDDGFAHFLKKLHDKEQLLQKQMHSYN
ncbi:glycosyltransferase [Acinetobacter sp. B51(2017)]|uniref:glycosyltransferase n=1 Tax=Acinetobacter sp. B51(2017) TaxID=2060938 RepID=UPI000F08029B|nr:glycosyltransferase [Acinetobacter sp. B51(2017)]